MSWRASSASKSDLTWSRTPGHNSKKIRSAISLGKHISNQIFGAKSLCHCDGCKVTQPKASASSMADIGAPIKMQPRKRKRTGEYANLAGVNTSTPPSLWGLGTAEGSEAGGDFDDATSVGTTETADYTFTGGDSAPPSPRKRTVSGGGSRGRGRASVPGSENGSTRGRGRGRGRAKRADDDDDYGDDDDGSDYSEEVGSVGPTAPRSTSARQRRPTSKVLSQIESNIPTAPGEPAADDYEALMTPAGKDVYRAMGVPTPEEVKEDLADPQASRVGELVWVRVPLGPPPTGELAHAQLSRWPGIVRGRAPAPENPREKVYRVELLGMSSEDTLEGVRSENVTPWLGYIPSNSAYLNANPPEDDGIAAGQPKKRWAAIQEEGWLAVARAFRQAHRIAKAYAAIQARPCVQSLVLAPLCKLTKSLEQAARDRARDPLYRPRRLLALHRHVDQGPRRDGRGRRVPHVRLHQLRPGNHPPRRLGPARPVDQARADRHRREEEAAEQSVAFVARDARRRDLPRQARRTAHRPRAHL